jgi:predicted ArsR family transcriptional regulator
VELVLGTHNLAGAGGTETYVLTVAEHLQRLGHGVTLFAFEHGRMTENGRSRGLRVVGEGELPESCDAALVQDGATSYLLADRYPSAPQVFRASSPLVDLHLPPQLAATCQRVVVLNDRLERLVRSLAVVPEVVRLRQPVDIERFVPLGPISEEPRRALLLGNYLEGERRRVLVEACESLGIAARQLGRHAGGARDPLDELAGADLVVGKGRSILEAMACGRAAFVYDAYGYDGWVTPESYGRLEARGFDGVGADREFSVDALVRDLSSYRPEMGLANRDLVVAHHNARAHAEELVSVFRGVVLEPPRPAAPFDEMSRLTRALWQAEHRAHIFARRCESLQAQIRELERGRRYRTGSVLAIPVDAWRSLVARGRR